MTYTDYPALTDNAVTVLERRYLARNEEGEITETPDDMFWRVADNLAQAERQYAEYAEWDNDGKAREDAVFAAKRVFYGVMRDLQFLPNSPTLMNAGLRLQQLSACFVLPIEDSLVSIFKAIGDAAIIHQSGGGTGFDFSAIRPAGDVVGSTGGVASGPLSFLDVFNAATNAIVQGGRRRGANMAILRYDHPDIEDFIAAKRDPKRWTNFNVSVAVDEQFMSLLGKYKGDVALKMVNPNNGEVLSYETGRDEYELVNPRNGEVIRKVSANKIFHQIVQCAWETGDPGLVFIDRINEHHPNRHLGEITSTNPCGEQPLLPYESCNLGSINLAQHVENGVIDWDALAETAQTGTRMLDNVVDMNKYPLPEIAEMSRHTRRIGVGVMGWADMLVKMGIRYDSYEALRLADEVMQFINEMVNEASKALGEERGSYLGRYPYGASYADTPMRNTSPTTIAPTGTISIIAGCSSGIEPLYALAYERNVLNGEKLIEVNEVFERAAKEWKFYSEELIQDLLEGKSLQDMDVPQHVKDRFRTSHDIPPEWHVAMQAAFQEHTDNSVSKTINLPKSATFSDVREAYLQAWRDDCRGITVYRDGSREGQVLSSVKPKSNKVCWNIECTSEDCNIVVEGSCATCYTCGWGKCG